MSVVAKKPGMEIVHVARRRGRDIELAVDDGSELGGEAIARLIVGPGGTRLSLWTSGRWQHLDRLSLTELVQLKQLLAVAFPKPTNVDR